MAWIAFELAFIRQFSLLQPAFVGVGGALVVTGLLGFRGALHPAA